MVVLCDGMVRSGSTWSFNVALELLRSSNEHQKTFGLFSEKPEVLLSAVRPRSSNLVIKSHKLDQSAYQLCRTGAIKAIYTWRHPYDAIVSCMRMFGWSFQQSIDVLRSSLRVWSFHRATNTAHVISYESIIQTPSAAIGRIASYLGVGVEVERLNRIARATSLDQVRSLSQHVNDLDTGRLVRMNEHVYDRQTLLHQGHVTDGRIGYGAGLLDLEQRGTIDEMIREEGFEFLCEPEAAKLV